jgi:hypothetical protein
LIRWLERLSLDAVIVAVVWGIALAELAGGKLDLWPVVVLALATWLTYVADRLWDVRPGRPVPETDRHRYYKCHYRSFAFAWSAVFVCVVLVAILDLPVWKWAGGWGVVACVVGYLALLARDWGPSSRLLLKRIAVPFIFTIGVGWMSECWRVLAGWPALGILLCGALANVLIISYWESHDTTRPRWLLPACWASVAGLASVGSVTLLLHIPLGGAGLVSAAAYAWLLMNVRPGSGVPVRALVDGVLAVSGILLLLSH